MLELKKFAEYFERLYIDFVRYTIENFDFYNDSINFDKLLQNAEKIESVVGYNDEFIGDFSIGTLINKNDKLFCSLNFDVDALTFNKNFRSSIIVYTNKQKYNYLPFVKIETAHIPDKFFTIDISLEKLILRAYITRKSKLQIQELFIPINRRFFSIFGNNETITLLMHTKNIPIVVTDIERNIHIVCNDFILILCYRHALKLKSDKLQNKFTYGNDKLSALYKIGFKPKTKINEIKNIVMSIIESYSTDFPIYYNACVTPSITTSFDDIVITLVGKTRTGSRFVFDLLLQE